MTRKKTTAPKPANSISMATDGALTITMPDGKPIAADLITLKLTAEEVERKHGAKAGWIPTAAFAADLAAAFAPHVPGCTVTIAYQLWTELDRIWIEVKKNTP